MNTNFPNPLTVMCHEFDSLCSEGPGEIFPENIIKDVLRTANHVAFGQAGSPS